jgi:hypothetical protein
MIRPTPPTKSSTMTRSSNLKAHCKTVVSRVADALLTVLALLAWPAFA